MVPFLFCSCNLCLWCSVSHVTLAKLRDVQIACENISIGPSETSYHFNGQTEQNKWPILTVVGGQLPTQKNHAEDFCLSWTVHFSCLQTACSGPWTLGCLQRLKLTDFQFGLEPYHHLSWVSSLSMTDCGNLCFYNCVSQLPCLLKSFGVPSSLLLSLHGSEEVWLIE